MKRHHHLVILTLLLILGTTLVSESWSLLKSGTGHQLTDKAAGFVELLDDQQTQQAVMPYETPKRVDWHFIPLQTRKGLMLRYMSEAQQEAALALLQSCLSEAGFHKTRKIMLMEQLLHDLENQPDYSKRDPQKYYVTLFGDPRTENRWGFSFEGHHLSLNFVIEEGEMIAASPQFFASNPAVIKSENDLNFRLGSAVLRDEEQLGFELVQSLNKPQLKQALIAQKAPKEIRAAGSPQPPTDAPEGIQVKDLNDDQQEILETLIKVYVNAVPEQRAKQRLKGIDQGGFQNIYFAWAGATKPGIGHYYRIQGDSFLIEFVNTQPDAAGNPANHVHCVWRDMHGDFALPIQ